MSPRRRFDRFDCEQALVKVLDVRTQNKFGVIFRGQRINADGEIQDTHNELIVRALHCDLAVPIMPGQWWNVTGQIKTRQFINNLGFQMTEDQMEVERGKAEMLMPSGAHIVDYLTRNPRFQGIGRITAERLWEAFQEALFGILDSGDTESLGGVVTAQKASVLVEGWREEGLSNSLQWLQAHGIGLRIGRRILGYFGSEAGSKITENPYRLLSFSAGWREVDAIAREKLHIKLDDERRLTAAIEETVYRKFSTGDTLVSRSDLFAGLRAILKDEGHSSDLIEKAIEHSSKTGRLLFDSEGNACSLGVSILENNVVDGIRLRIGRKSATCGVDQIIRSYENREGHGFTLNKEQREAVHLIAENDFSVVTGGAGVGKTTVLKCVFVLLEDQGYDITQLALAGKAVKRMMEATGRPAITLASFINKAMIAPIAPGKKALVIDEASMVDLISFSTLLRLIDDDTKIVLIGDPHQLPPVGPGLILHCLTTIQWIPHVELKVAKRFGSEIAGIANSVKDGLFPGIDQFNKSVRFIEADKDQMEDLGSGQYLEQPEDSVVLCATRKVAHFINLKIQESMTRSNKPLRLFNFEVDMWEHTGFYEGDLLICTRNHWDIGIQNGSLGKLVEVFDEPAPLDSDGEADPKALGWVEWDDGEKRPLREDLLDSLELGYAMTVHKSQGSQWRRVIICLPSPRFVQSSLIERSMIYTAITRSQREVIIFGNHEHLVKAVSRDKAADRRKIGLPKRLVRIPPVSVVLP